MLVLNVSNNGCFCAVVIQAGHTILAFSPQMESCGVSQCENGGELWMCVTIRFPMLPGSVFSIELTDFLDSYLGPQPR